MSNLSDFFPGGSPTTDGGTIPDNLSLNDLVDVSLTSPIVNEVLFYNGSIWVDKQLAYSDLDPSSLPTIPTNFDDLNDVSVSAPTDGQYLQFNTGSGLWIPSDINTIALTLEQLTDVVINSPTDLQPLVYNTTTSQWNNASINIDTLTDVDTTTAAPVDGQVLAWNGSAWIPGTPASTDRLEDDDADTYISVSEVDDQVTVQAGPNNGYIMLKPNAIVDADAAVVIDDGTGEDGYIEIEGANDGNISSTLGLDISATNDLTIQGLVYPAADGASGQVMTTDGSGTITFSDKTDSLTQLNDVDITDIVDDEILVWNTDKFVRGTVGSLSSVSFVDLTDTPTDYAGAANKVVLVNPGATGLIYGDAPASSLAGLTDTNVSGTPQNKFLKNIAGIWNDSTVEISDVNSLQTTLDSKLSGTSVINDLSDVNAVAPNNNDILYWNNGNSMWQAKAPTEASTLIGLSDTPAGYGTTDGQMLISDEANNRVIWADVPAEGVPEALPMDGTIYGRQDGNWVDVVGASISTFAELTDTPNNYAGMADKLVSVKTDMTGLEFIDAPDAGLTDRIQDDDNDTYVTVSEIDDRVTVQAGPDDGNIYLQPNTTVNAAAAVVVDDGVSADGTIEATGELNLTGTKLKLQGLTYPSADGTVGQVISTDGNGVLTFTSVAAGGVTDFVGLSDTPANYTSSNGFTVKVNAGGTALEFVDVQPVDITGKADKIVPATVGNFAGLDASGNLTDSGSTTADFATAAQGALADTALQSTSVINDLADVDTATVAPTDTQILTWVDANGTWEPKDAPAGGSASPLTTKGDIIAYSTEDARVPVGTDGQVLTVDLAEDTGVKWADAAGGGGSTFESARINYFLGGTIQTVTEASAGITAAVIAGGATVSFEFTYSRPPSSIVIYGYKDLGTDGYGYKMTMPASASQNHFVLTGGTVGAPAEVLTSMSPGKIKMTLTLAETFADSDQHAYVFFNF